MMTYETKDGQGAMFKNPDKTPDNNFPDYRGNGKFQGVSFDVSGWIKQGKKGPYMSLSFKPPYKKSVKVAGDDDTKPRTMVDMAEDDLPPF
jgi:hypothetical protein